MDLLTQKHGDNCLQTCVAMILGRAPEKLPDQHVIGADYVPSLRNYLRKHDDITYIEVGRERFAEMSIKLHRVFHLIIGETVRTSPNNDVWHAVVGVGGKFHWDVHPSRAGLTKVFKWGFVSPIPAEWRADMDRKEADDPNSALCVCVDCAASRKSAEAQSVAA